MKLKKASPKQKAFVLALIRMILGITFVYSSYHKIEDPAAFATIIYGYGVFPDVTINILAVVLPFLELVCGFCLIFNLLPGSAALLINAMLVCFSLLIFFNLVRGHTFDCGCFSFAASSHSTLANIYSLVRDLFLLGCGVYLQKNIRAF